MDDIIEKVGFILRNGAWRVHSFAYLQGKQFLEDLRAEGYEVVSSKEDFGEGVKKTPN
jgi:hypothetical protein